MAGAKKRAKKPVGRDRVLFNILSYAVLTALSAACLLPFLLVLSGSVSEQYSIQLHGYRLFPETSRWTHTKCCSAFRKSCCGPMALRFL